MGLIAVHRVNRIAINVGQAIRADIRLARRGAPLLIPVAWIDCRGWALNWHVGVWIGIAIRRRRNAAAERQSG